MLEPRLLAALAAGAIVVTPNNRLARTLVASHDAAQRAAGRRAWAAARALPWTAWLRTLWDDVIAADALPDVARRLAPSASLWCWQRIVLRDGAALSDARGAADIAADAWQLMKAWGAGGESWRGFAGAAAGADDVAVFARWAARYQVELSNLHAVDDATLADALGEAADTVARWRSLDVVMAGFIETSPQQERLLAALARQGAQITHLDTLPPPGGAVAFASAASPRDEIRMALAWARESAIADPQATIGIAVLDLEARRDEIRRHADDLLCPALALAGNETAGRPYNLSLGVRLVSVPIVAAALGVIEILAHPVDAATAGVLLRSPYLPAAEMQWTRRAAIELEWLAHGRRDVSLRDVIAALTAADASLGLRFERAASDRGPSHAAPREWVRRWRDALVTIGWPGDRTPDSAEHQARAAFEERLEEFAGLTSVEARMRAADAVTALRDLLGAALFQPEAPAAPIQIVGVLEAAGMPFDRLWVAGLSADSWPAAPRPNPFLPLGWQQTHDVPRSSAARELRYARATTAALLRGAPSVVMSAARHVDDHPELPSRLIATLGLPKADAVVPMRSYAEEIRAAAGCLEGVADERAPALAPGRAPGGARLIELQAACPFQAIAAHRLRVETWPEITIGLSPRERGTLAHEALAAFWHEVRDHAGLVGRDDAALGIAIERAVARAMDNVTPMRWREVPPVVRAGESRRLAGLIRGFIDAEERERPPFEVVGIERSATATLAGLEFRLRIDRIDRIGADHAIIDYKTGIAPPLAGWFDLRPRAPQLGLYTLAVEEDTAPVEARALAYAQLRVGESKVVGVTADAALWPHLTTLGATPIHGGWNALVAWWRDRLGALAGEIREGVADVSPRDGDKTCRICERYALCRVRAAYPAWSIGHE